MDLKIFNQRIFNFLKKIIPPHPLTNFEIQKFYQNGPRFNGVYSRDNLPKKVKDAAYYILISLDEYADVGAHWIALYVLDIEIIYFDSFGVEHVPKEIKKIIGHKNIFRIQANNSIACGYFCIGFTDFSLFLPHDFEKNDDIILNCFKTE